MSYNLWRYLLEDDVDSFRQYLAHATYSSVAPRNQGGLAGGYSPQIGSPGALATSPKAYLKSRKSSGNVNTSNVAGRGPALTLTRADINGKDSFGRSLLHHAASKQGPEAHGFIKTLLELPYVDLYAQDTESGWTALHRALYYGNIASAQALMQRDFQDATDYNTAAARIHGGGLVKIKDNEGNSPFEVFGLAIAPRDIQSAENTLPGGNGENDSSNSVDLNDDPDVESLKRLVRPSVDLQGDDVFAFGSNKNFSLGTGDEDDRHFPERLHLIRPDHLLVRLHEDHVLKCRKAKPSEALTGGLSSLTCVDHVPALIRHKAIIIQDVVMSKFHTAVLTDDPISNLYICGFGPGGRLGTGDEITSFRYKAVQGGGLAKRRVSAIALGQDHTVVICSLGEVFTWGSNQYGQLGYTLPDVPSKEVPAQLLPRQVYGLVKKELFIGAAASSIHSAIYTPSSLYTFGKNAGQLGLMDADARSLEMQTLPRRVAPSVLQAPISSVSAIDRATIVHLETHEVIVFTHYGWTKTSFQLQGLTTYSISDAMSTRYDNEGNYIKKITSSGNTICAMSSYGEVFTIEVPKVAESVPSSVSTTNPTKARNALPAPVRVWSIRKSHMSAIDVAVGQDGSIILCTMSGSVWRKEKRANIKTVRDTDGHSPKPTKDYKFVRVPNLTRAIAVRSNAFGAFTAVRKDTDVTREQVMVDPASLWADIFTLLNFRGYGEVNEDETTSSPQPRFWRPATRGPSPAQIKRAVITRSDCEDEILKLCRAFEPLSDTQYDAWITSNVTEVRFPIHSFLFKARSSTLRTALTQFQEMYYFSIPDVLSIEYGHDGQVQIQFHGADFLTLANLVFYLYTDEVIDVWHFTSKALQSAARYRAVRTELMKIASNLDLLQLERAVRLMIDPVKSLCIDMEEAVLDTNMFSDADVIIELSGGAEQPAHTVLLCARCPFFQGLFNGRAGGVWMSSRRGMAEEASDVPRVDLKHVEPRVFRIVLRHIYADTGTELFDDIVVPSFEDFADLVLEVMSVANELMIDRLAQICQNVIGRFVNTRNVCRLLNAIAECTVNEFKQAALEYICLNLETMLEQGLLEELDPELLPELDEVVQANQLAYMPFARSNRAQERLLDQHPELAEELEKSRKTRIDSMRLRSRRADDEQREGSYQKFRLGSQGASAVIADSQRSRSSVAKDRSPGQSPYITARDIGEELPFEMDEDAASRQQQRPSAFRSPSLPPDPAEKDELISSSLGLGQTPEATRSLLSGKGKEPLASPTSSSPMGAPPTMESIKGFGADTTPWQTSPQVSKGLGLKDIMEQASSVCVSSLTQSLKQAQESSKPTQKVTQKVSQKERKKQAQRQKSQTADDDRQHIPVAATNTEIKPATKQSPWQAHKQHRIPAEIEATSNRSRRGSEAAAEQYRPAMTTRQKGNREISSPSTPAVKGIRSVSGPAMTPSHKPATPVIQSIRHTPAPARSGSNVDARTSMAEILAQQSFEKTAVKEAVAKRSLQEIQQEQEFQEWWDIESQKVQEQEAQADASTSRRGRGGGGRGRQSGGRRSGGIIADDRVDKTAGPQRSAREQTGRGGANRSRGEGRARGRGRGRGH